ncbi:hypothetical protein BJX66DRAFT_294798, partial [Aspergillus keveii]
DVGGDFFFGMFSVFRCFCPLLFCALMETRRQAKSKTPMRRPEVYSKQWVIAQQLKWK